MKARLMRVNEEIARVVADIIRSEMSDPGLGPVCSVTRAQTDSDLGTCKVWVSILGPVKVQQRSMASLKRAQGFVRSRVAQIVNLRKTPQIVFIQDTSIDEGMQMRSLIDSVNAADAAARLQEATK